MAMHSKRRKGQCLYKQELDRGDRGNEKEEVKSSFRYRTETPDELCLKAEATCKLTFATLANSPRKTRCQLENARINQLGYNHYLKVSLQKLKQ